MALDSVRAKLARAHEHILEVDAALSGAEARTRYIVTRYRRLPPEAHIIDMGDKPPEDPMRVPLLVGEVLQNLRSALDHLIGELERGNGLNKDSQFEFPIFWDAARYKRESSKKVRGVPAAALAVIEKSQPYHRPAPSYKDHPLWILHDLNNADKHRVLIGTSNSITIDNLDIGPQPGEHRDVVLSISPRHRANPQPEPGTAEKERMTLNANFTMFGQRNQQPIIPGCLSWVTPFLRSSTSAGAYREPSR